MRKSGRARENAWGEQEIGDKWGGDKGEGVARYFSHSLPVLFPLRKL